MLTQKIRIVLFTLLCAGKLASQPIPQNPYWTLPQWYAKVQPPQAPKSIPQFTAGVYYSPEGDYTVSNYAHNSISNAGGKPVFYIADGWVFDSTGNAFDRLQWTKHVHRQITTTCNGFPTTGDIIGGGGWFDQIAGFSEVCLVQNPANCKQWYIFTAGAIQNDGSHNFSLAGGSPLDVYTFYPYQSYPFYALLDLSQNQVSDGAPGVLQTFSEPDDVVTGYNINCTPATITYTAGTISNNTKEIFTLIYDNTQPCKANAIHYAATDNITNGGTYKLVFVTDGDSIYALKVTGTGSTPVTRVQQTGSHHGHALPYGSYNSGFRSEMEVVKLSNGNYQVAAPYYGNGGYGIHITQFNNAGLEQSSNNFDVLLGTGNSNPYPHGLEFNPDGSKLYFTHETNTTYTATTNYVTVWTGTTVSTGTTSTVSSIAGIPSISDLAFSQIELNYQSSVPYLYFADSTNLVNYNLITGAWTTTVTTFPSPHYKKAYPSFYYGAPQTGFYEYLLPDQIDGGFYPGSTGADPTCCVFYNEYDKDTYTTTGTNTVQVWTAGSNPVAATGNTTHTLTIGSELRIAPGYSVTIQDMTIKFTPQASLIVQGRNGSIHGGQLTLKKCTLDVDTRCASKMWPGVRVWGDNTVSRGGSNQGYIIMDSSCVITNAWIGVELGYDVNDLTYSAIAPAPTNSATAGGGMIVANNSSFINNQRDVRAMTYTTTGGFTSINTCTLVTNAYLLGTPTPTVMSHIELNDYKPLAIIKGDSMACSSSLTNSGYFLANYGIKSTNSNFTTDIGSSKTPCFNNFLTGVSAACTGGNTATFTVKNAHITSNVVGVGASYVTNAVVENNTFKLYNNSIVSNGSGLYLDNCTGYWVQDNSFAQNSSGNKKLYGIVAYNSGASANSIFRNTFSNLYKGCQAQYINYGPVLQIANGTGLLFMCNTFTSNSITAGDIYVPARTENTNVGTTYTCSPCSKSGIAYAQGAGGSASSLNRPTADNQFSHSTNGKDFWMGVYGTDSAYTSSYVYFCATGLSCPNTTYTSVWKPDPLKSNNYLPSAWTLTVSPDCNTGHNGHREVDPLTAAMNDINFYTSQYDSLEAAYNTHPGFQLNLEMASSFSSWQLAYDRAIRTLLANANDSSETAAKILMRQKATRQPARVRLEVGLNIQDSTFAAQALTEVAASEGQSNYVKLHTILLQNLHKSPQQLLSDTLILQQIQAMDNDSSDHTAFLKANLLLQTVGLSDYSFYYQENDPSSDSSFVQRVLAKPTVFESNLTSTPNPFKESTVIRTAIPDKTENAFVILTDMLGKEFARYRVYQGETEIKFDGSEYGQQVFFCTLVIDGVKIKTNKLVLIK